MKKLLTFIRNRQLKSLVTTIAGCAVALFFAATAGAAVTTVFVDGRSGPWDIATNPSYPYADIPCCGGPDIHLAPTAVSSTSGLSFAAGNSLRIEYVSGLANAGGSGLYYDANGVTWWPIESGGPGQYIAGDNYLEQVVGVFANSAGVIVGSPFTIGNGPVLKVIPSGVTQLLLGFNDGWYTDNGAGLYMKVSDAATLSAIIVTPATPTINLGQTQQFTATGTFSDGTTASLTGTFSTSGSSIEARHIHAATLLANGKVLVVGGQTLSGQRLATAELYDPVTGTFSATGSMSMERFLPTATLLKSGKVLVVGGQDSRYGSIAKADLYDPATGTFSATGSMLTPRYGHTATLLESGKVLVAGGYSGSELMAPAELYDPDTGIFTATGSASTPLYHRTATLLGNGKVLLAGGYTLSEVAVSTADLYDPATGTFTSTGNMINQRYVGTATLLRTGKVLIAGGLTGTAEIASAELYDPATGTFSATGSMAASRWLHAATLLGDGQVLVVGGGTTPRALVPTAELYDPVTGTFSATGSMAVARDHHTATLLDNGKVLVVGGDSTSELYTVGATWASSNASTATITSTGLASGLSPGTTTISATWGSLSGNTLLTVVNPNHPPVANAGLDQTVIVTGTTTAITLNGSGSTDPDNDTLTYSWSGTFGAVAGVNPVIALPLGSHTITLTVSDGKLSSTDTVVIKVVYGFGGFLPPLTADSRTTFHLGSVIPVKFDLYNANGTAISTAVAQLSLQKLDGGDPVGAPIDATPSSGADTGNLFRYNGGHYAYNLSTKPFTAGIWRIQATLNDGTVRTIDVGLTSK